MTIAYWCVFAAVLDRKSTRLNSSHVRISYAVFCLKKKTFVQEAKLFDARLLTLDTATQRYLTLEKKALMVDSFAKWRIFNVQRYYTATSGMRSIAEERLSRQLESGLRNEVARRTLHEVVAGERDQLMADITADLNFFFSDTATTEIYTLSLHDALPI